MKAAEVLMLIFAVVIGAATFIENDYGTQTAQALVYKTRWFELLLFLFTAAVIYNIFHYKMYRRAKWGQLILHLAFVMIAVGAAVTRYVGYEGILHLRNGQTSSTMVSDHMALEVSIVDGKGGMKYTIPMYLSAMGGNRISETFTYEGQKVDVDLVRYIPSAHKKGDHYVTGGIKPTGMFPQVITLEVTHNGMSKKIDLEGRKAEPPRPKTLDFGDIKVQLGYGAKIIDLPFAVRLDKFVLERYPGSMMPSSYESFVTVIDKENNTTFPYHIYMNHVLSYRGYRFFQSSYDTDEQGSILSVNHDPGTLPTYIGYIMLIIGFVWSFLSPKGRISQLRKKLQKLKAQNVAALFVVLAIISFPSVAKADDSVDLTPIHKISPEHAKKFARLVVQSSGGRMEPVDSSAREILSKISHKRSWEELSPEQVLLGMLTKPQLFQKVRMIKVSHPMIAKKLGLPKDTKYISYNDMFDKKGNYILADDIRKAARKAAGERDQYDKELIKVDERVNVEYMVFQGALLRIFPKPKDKSKKWYSPIEAVKTFDPKLGEMVRLLVSNYFQNIDEAIKSGSWQKADTALEMISKYQKFYGSDLMPSQTRISAEIWYNKLRLFDWLVLAYILIGLIVLVLSFTSIVKSSFQPRRTMRVLVGLLVIAFLVHTFGMGLRWYVAGHAPWSDAYESLIFIAWATSFAGFYFVKRSPLTFAATSILAGIFMFVAFLSYLDPQITNLIPVLKSYWLTIHVAVITASYGFLGLGSLLGLLVLVLFIVRGNKPKPEIERSIKELTYINEMGLLIGLALLTVGNFLGGVWANESWGRYWGWDPKETWAAVTILVYAVVVHMRFIPKLNNIFAFNVAAVLAYGSVIMTYFGVNYYLSGLHSYAAGDPVPIPGWVTPALIVLGTIILWASRYKKNVK